jgi:methionyl-tRNA formyltransferase
MEKFIIATIKKWNIDEFEKNKSKLKNFSLITSPEELTLENIKKINPKYIFFPHWSWIVPKEIVSNYNCVCFHMTDLPFGRGGSPLQNLISRDIRETKISALKMSSEVDAGPIYMKRPLDLSGSAQEIFERASKTVFEMIEEILISNPTPIEQTGAPVFFKRRTPDQSELPDNLDLNGMYNFIRMLDAETYPLAFVSKGKIKFHFKNVKIINNQITGDFFATEEK